MKRISRLLTAIFILSVANVVRADQAHYDLATPQSSWQSVIKALQSGDVREVKSVTTPKGFKSIAQLAGGKNLSERLSEIGESWQAMEIRWQEQVSQSARALLGPEIKEQGLDFVRTKQGWKL